MLKRSLYVDIYNFRHSAPEIDIWKEVVQHECPAGDAGKDDMIKNGFLMFLKIFFLYHPHRKHHPFKISLFLLF